MNNRRIDLWCVFPDQIADPALWDAYRGLLSPEETQREQRFTHDEPRRQFLAGRALLRTVLAQYTGVDPRRLEFQCNRHGKPSLRKENLSNNSRGLTAPGGASRDPRTFRGLLAPGYFHSHEADLPLEFSLSHTRGLVVCAVALRDAVGVDVEWAGRESAPLELARRFFAPAEAERLAKLPPEDSRPPSSSSGRSRRRLSRPWAWAWPCRLPTSPSRSGRAAGWQAAATDLRSPTLAKSGPTGGNSPGRGWPGLSSRDGHPPAGSRMLGDRDPGDGPLGGGRRVSSSRLPPPRLPSSQP